MPEDTTGTDWEWIEYFYHNEPKVQVGFNELVYQMKKAGKDFELADLMGLLGCPNARRPGGEDEKA